MARKLTRESIIKRGGIGALKLQIKEQIKSLMKEQGSLPMSKQKGQVKPVPRYRIDAGGCLPCGTNANPTNCPYTDPNCTNNASGGQVTYTCKSNKCTKVVGKGGVGEFATLDDCMESGCGERARPVDPPVNNIPKMTMAELKSVIKKRLK